jgi:autotransporter-associated beta strand protein
LGAGSKLNIPTSATVAMTVQVDQGTMTVNRVERAGRLTKTGAGTLIVTGDPTVATTGIKTIAGGTLQLGDGGASGSIFTTTAGSLTNNGSFVYNRNDPVTFGNLVAGTGTVTQMGTGTLLLSGANTYTGRSIVKAGVMELGTAAQNPVLTLSPGGADIQFGKMVFDYTTTAPNVLTPLTASYNGGLWNTGRFLSTTEDTMHGLGWGNDTVNQKVAVMYTLYGDSNLDGSVDGTDLNNVLSNYNATGANWSQGDFNYDGSVDGTDLNTVLSNYNQHLSVGAAVPEPSTLLLAAMGLVGLLCYAWRKRK